MSCSRDGETIIDLNNGSSMELPRLSETITGNHTHLTSNRTEAQATSDAPLPTQDGGNSSDMITQLPLSIMREEKLLKLLEVLMLRTEILVLMLRTTRSTNNGTSST